MWFILPALLAFIVSASIPEYFTYNISEGLDEQPVKSIFQAFAKDYIFISGEDPFSVLESVFPEFQSNDVRVDRDSYRSSSMRQGTEVWTCQISLNLHKDNQKMMLFLNLNFQHDPNIEFYHFDARALKPKFRISKLFVRLTRA
jgi:hypothetical protein